MENLLRKIYEEVIIYGKDSYELNHRLEYEIREMIYPYIKKAKMNDEESESFRDLCFDISASAQYSGFLQGVKLTVKILIEILTK